MDIRTKLINICRELKSLGDNEMADKVLCAYAAISDTEKPRVDLSYSYIMRKLRKDNTPEQVRSFQKAFKTAFEKALDADLDEPDNIALTSAL